MGRHRSRSRSYSPVRRKRHDEPRDRRHDRRSPAPSGLLVRNISLSARPEDVRVPFERFGPVKDVYLPKNYYTGYARALIIWLLTWEPRGFGFVKFRYAEDAAEAKAHLNCTVIGGREIRIVFAEENRKTPQEMNRVLRTRDRDRENRDDYYSPRRCRSKSPSVSLRDERNYRLNGRSSRQSRQMSRSNSPRIQKKGRSSPSPRDNSPIAHDVDSAPRRLERPGRNADSSARSRSRSYSPR